LILAQAALDDFIRLHGDLNCYTGQSSRNNSPHCGEFNQLRGAVELAGEKLGRALADAYQRLLDAGNMPPHNTEQEANERRQQILLAAVGIIIPLTLEDAAIEVAFYGLGKIARLFTGVADFFRTLTKSNAVDRLGEYLQQSGQASERINGIKLAQYDGYPALQNLDYSDVVRIENSVGQDKLRKFNDALESSPELANAIDANPHLADTWRFLDDTAEGACSFDGHMEVPTLRGNISIQNIIPGEDHVLAKDEISGLLQYKLVTQVYSNLYEKQFRITSVNNQSGELQTVVSNAIHPIFVVPALAQKVGSSEGHVYEGNIVGGQWIDAANLSLGDQLLNAKSGYSTVVEITHLNTRLQAYNLSVKDFNTFFISAPGSATAYWVHNNCFNIDAIKNDPVALERLTEDVRAHPRLKELLDGNPELVDSWNQVKDTFVSNPDALDTFDWLATAGRTQTIKSGDAIEQIHSMRGNADFLSTVGGEAEFARLLDAQTTGLPVGEALVNHLKNTEIVLDKFKDTPGIDSLLTDLKNSSHIMQEGTRFTISQMKDINPNAIARIDDAFDINCGTACRYDVKLTDGTLVEYKSVQGFSRENKTQLESYLGNTTDIDKLNYVFDSSKQQTVQDAKDMMQGVFQQDPDRYLNSMSPELRNSLGGTVGENLTEQQQRDAIKRMMDDTSSELYDFIEISQ